MTYNIDSRDPIADVTVHPNSLPALKDAYWWVSYDETSLVATLATAHPIKASKTFESSLF